MSGLVTPASFLSGTRDRRGAIVMRYGVITAVGATSLPLIKVFRAAPPVYAGLSTSAYSRRTSPEPGQRPIARRGSRAATVIPGSGRRTLVGRTRFPRCAPRIRLAHFRRARGSCAEESVSHLLCRAGACGPRGRVQSVSSISILVISGSCWPFADAQTFADAGGTEVGARSEGAGQPRPSERFRSKRWHRARPHPAGVVLTVRHAPVFRSAATRREAGLDAASSGAATITRGRPRSPRNRRSADRAGSVPQPPAGQIRTTHRVTTRSSILVTRRRNAAASPAPACAAR